MTSSAAGSTRDQGEPDDGTDTDGRHTRAVTRVMAAGRENSTTTVMFHGAIAEKVGLGANESKTLDLLQRHGPLTAKDLVGHTGLAPASVTGLVDRLEAKGFVRRAPHPTDKRRVVVELRPENLAPLAATYEEWGREIAEMCEQFTTEELDVVTRFLDEATARARRTVARLAE